MVKHIQRHDQQAYKEAIATVESLFAKSNASACSKCKTTYGSNGWKGKSDVRKDRGCCGDCGRQTGYFYASRDGLSHFEHSWDLTDIERLPLAIRKHWWDHAYGFFNPIDLRCNLPRELRSNVCLGFHCANTHRGMGDKKYTEWRGTLNKCLHTISAIRTKIPTWYKQVV
jgi:hypothetical protein